MKKGDIFVFLAIILLWGVLAAFFMPQKQSGAEALIVIDGIIVKTVGLSGEDEVFSIDGMVFELKDNKLRFAESNCPDRLCVRRGFISSPGETSACIPNGAIIRITGDSPEFDIIVQ